MIGDCAHQNFKLWNCAPGFAVRNGEDFDKSVRFNRSKLHKLKWADGELIVNQATRSYEFDCDWQVRVNEPWICAGCDGHGGYDNVEEEPPARPGPWVVLVGLNGKAEPTYSYHGSVSDNTSVLMRKIKYLDPRGPIIAYDEELRTVSYAAESDAPLGYVTILTEGNGKVGQKTVYVGDMLKFDGVLITKTFTRREVVLVGQTEIVLSSSTSSSTETKNLAIGKKVGPYVYFAGGMMNNFWFRDYYNLTEDDGYDMYAPEWLRQLLEADESGLAERWTSTQVESSVIPTSAELHLDKHPIGSWATDSAGNVFISQMSSTNNQPFNKLLNKTMGELQIPILGDPPIAPTFYHPVGEG